MNKLFPGLSTLVMIFLFSSISHARDYSKFKIIIIKPKATTEIEDKELKKDIEEDMQIGILNLIVVDSENFEIQAVKDENIVKDFHNGKITVRQLLDHYEADVVVFGDYSLIEEKINLNLQVQTNKLNESHVNYNKSIHSSIGVYPLVNDFMDNHLDDIINPLKDNTLGIKFGYPINVSSYIGNLKTSIPYVGLFFRHTFLEDRSFLLEYELGFFSFKDNEENTGYLVNNIPTAGTITSHNIPVTVSVLYQIFLSKSFQLIPKVGIGYMFTYTVAPSEADNAYATSSFLLAKPSLEINYKFSSRFGINLDNSFLMAFQMTNFKTLMFYNPTLGFHYSF